MHRTLLDLGFVKIHSYGFFLAASFLLGILLARRRAERRGIPGERVDDVALVVIVTSIVGARALYVLTHLDQFQGRLLDVFRTWEGGLVMYGGAVPAVVLGMWFLRRWGVDAWKAADAIAPSMALGLALTRIGCFLSGCCYGAPTTLPWGCVFPPESHAGMMNPGVPLHPAQLYESAAGFAICGLLLALDRRPLPRGALLLVLLAFYSVERFLVDMVRAYEPGAYPFPDVPLTLNQWISLGVLLFVALRVPAFRRAGAPADA
jgi:phosphatidylglycerol:prolipoprotein diacylglycerol transferase